MAFNRPDYLRQVLSSLRAQDLEGCAARFTFHFFQDGAVNRYSGVRYADDEDIAACTALARALMPGIDLHVSPDNIGVAEMFAAAESFVFDRLEADYAIFLEDDMVLDPRYLRTMAGIREHTVEHEEIGVFAAYGNHNLEGAGVSECLGRPQAWVPLGQHWAFAVTRTHWRAIQPFMRKYQEIVHHRDYRRRNHVAVRSLLDASGTPSRDTSQDKAKAVAAFLASRLRLNIELPLGRYIGEHGVHFRPELYRQLGYDRPPAVIPAGEVMLQPVTDDDLARLRRLAAERTAAERISAERQPGLRLVTREDVHDLYRLLLEREPEGEDVYRNAVGNVTLADLRNGIINSTEYRSNNEAAPFLKK
jgi:hypothetical protein